MHKMKEQDEGQDKPAPVAAVQDKPAAHDKKGGPLPVELARANEKAKEGSLAPDDEPTLAPDDIEQLTAPRPGMGAAKRARKLRAMQRKLGNARVAQLVGAEPPSPQEQEKQKKPAKSA